MVVTRKARAHHLSRAAVLLVAGATAVGVLAGCSGPANTDKPTKTLTTQPTSTPSNSKTSTPTPTEDPWNKVALTCDTLLTADQMYAYNPNFGVDPNYQPTAKSDAADIASHNGLACGWMNQTSGEKIEIAIGRPPEEKLTALKNRAIRESNPVPTYGVPPDVEGYFKNANGTGEAQVFQGEYWIIERSTAFFEPGDAAPLVQDVQDNLSQG